MDNNFNQVVLNKILKNLDLNSIKSCSLVNKQFNKAFNMDILWHSLFISHHHKSTDEYKTIFGTNSYLDYYSLTSIPTEIWNLTSLRVITT